MHFAYPSRKSSNPPPFVPRSTQWPALRRRRLKVLAVAGLAFIALLYLLSRRRGSGRTYTQEHIPSGNPPAVLVTVFDESDYGREYLDAIRENRKQYAEKHGYETFFPRIGDYDLAGAPFSWTKVVASRDALTRFPDTSYIWFLDQDSFIMNPDLTIEQHVMNPAQLENLMIKDQPIVPPDSIIKTFTHLRAKDIDFVLTQDKDGLSAGSFIIRNGDWARFLLETWYDPIYRTYNFQKAETHALEHIVQWHPTILSKLAIVPQNRINSYSMGDKGVEYTPGDMVVRFGECSKINTKACEAEAQRFASQWRSSFKGS